MNGFINNIIKRHLNADNAIMPRLPGRFEQFNGTHQSMDMMNDPGQDFFNIESTENLAMNKEAIFPAATPVSNQDISSSGIDIHNDSRHSVSESNTLSSEDTETTSNEIGMAFQYKQNFLTTDNKVQETTFESSDMHSREESRFFKHGENSNRVERGDINIDQRNVKYHNNELFRRNNYHISDFGSNHDAAPIIKVSIGRIEVRATISNQPEKKPDKVPQKTGMSLENYLQKRNGDK